MWNKKRIFLIYFFSILFLSCFFINFQSKFIVSNNHFSYSEENLPNTSQLGSNITLNIIKPGLIIIEGHIAINVSSANFGQIHYALTEQSGDRYFININQTMEILGNNQSHLLTIRVTPLITTFPGEYHFTLNITGLFTYSETFDIFLGMGYSLFTIILGFVAFMIIIIVLKRRNTDKTKKIKGDSLTSIKPSSQPVLKGKIACPNCKKAIDEGLAFCPECGERIPEFLRYNPK